MSGASTSHAQFGSGAGSPVFLHAATTISPTSSPTSSSSDSFTKSKLAFVASTGSTFTTTTPTASSSIDGKSRRHTSVNPAPVACTGYHGAINVDTTNTNTSSTSVEGLAIMADLNNISPQQKQQTSIHAAVGAEPITNMPTSVVMGQPLAQTAAPAGHREGTGIISEMLPQETSYSSGAIGNTGWEYSQLRTELSAAQNTASVTAQSTSPATYNNDITPQQQAPPASSSPPGVNNCDQGNNVAATPCSPPGSPTPNKVCHTIHTSPG